MGRYRIMIVDEMSREVRQAMIWKLDWGILGFQVYWK